MLRNLTRALAGLGLAGLPLVAAAQEKQGKNDPPNWVESRFHRVHLKNGNFIDGALVSKDHRLVVLKLKAGDFGIRADMIQRLEFMKVRSLHEEPPVVAFRKEETPDGPPVVVASAPTKEAPAAPAFKSNAPEALKPLVEALSTESAEKRKAKLRDLLEKPEGPAQVASLMEHVPDEVRGDIADLLSEKKASTAVPVLLKLLKHANASVREQSLRALAGAGNESTVPQVEFCLADSSPLVRAAAIMVFQRQGDADVFDRVGLLLRDPDGTVRGTALAALVALAGRHQTKEKLTQVFRDEIKNAPPETAASMVTAMGKLKDKELGPDLAALVEGGEPPVRATAIVALIECDPTMAGKVILERFEVETEYAPRLQLANGAKTLRLKAAIPTLLGWLEDEDPNIVSATSTALRGITGQNFGSDLERWQSWWETAKPK